MEFLPNDTLKFAHRTGGDIDTFDLTYGIPYTTVPSTGFSNSFQLLTIDYIRNNPSLFAFRLPQNIELRTISALPHLGFAYSFGLKGTQFLHTDYQQTFKSNLLLNLEIDRQSSGGFALNSGYSDNSFKIGLYRENQKIDFSLKGAYSFSDRKLNNGIPDSIADILDSLSLPFASVNNSSSFSISKGANVSLHVDYNISKDSSAQKYGIGLLSNYQLLNREFENSADSIRDQFQEASIKNAIGLFVKNKMIYLYAAPYQRYWRLQNSGTNQDTNELGFMAHFILKKKAITLESNFDQNIVGAQQEIKLKNRFSVVKNGYRYSAWANLENILQRPVQRFYTSQSFNYVTPLTKQNRIDIGIGGEFSFWKIDAKLKGGLFSTTNNLTWTDSTWQKNNYSNIQLGYLESQFHCDFDWFQWYPKITIQTGSAFVPNTILSGRMLVKKKVFEAKKLELQFAIDPQWNSNYQFLGYDINLDNYFYSSANRVGGQNFSLHTTFTLGLDEFRFFIRGENLQSFWTDGSTEILQNYYRAPFVLRLGFSWDFFN